MGIFFVKLNRDICFFELIGLENYGLYVVFVRRNIMLLVYKV